MASAGVPAPPEATASKVKPFSDERVCRLQLCNIYLELAPKYLLTMLEQYVVLCEEFKDVGKKVDGNVVWDEKQKDWLVAQMKKKVNFTNKKATGSPVAEWDVSALCAALLAVSIPKDIAEEVRKVRESRNTISHGKMAARDDLKPNVETVQNLKPHLDAVRNLKPHVEAVQNLIQLVKPSFPDQPWDHYLEELCSAADTETFRKMFTNAEGVPELQKKVEHMIEGVQKCGEEGEELRKELEEWRSDLKATMRPWNKAALNSMRQELGRVKMGVMIKMLEKADVPNPDNKGFLSHVQLQVVESEKTPAGQMNKVIDYLLEMEDIHFEYFCQILEQSNFVGKANMLREKAKHLKRYVVSQKPSRRAPPTGPQSGDSLWMDTVD